MREIKAVVGIVFLVLLVVACANDTTPTITIATDIPLRNAPTNTARSATQTRAAATATRPNATATRVPATVTVVPPTPTATTILPTATSKPLPPLSELPSLDEAGWNAFVASIEGIGDVGLEQTQADTFWQDVTSKQRVPLLLNNAAIFLYKGAAQSVYWQGDFSYWDSGVGLDGKQVGQTDLWYAVAHFPQNSRTDYEIVVNGENGIRDPANPRTRWSSSGTNSVLTMPKFQVTDFTRKRDDVAEGVLTDWTPLASAAWGAPIRYSVYTPADYAALEHLPVLYVTDGSDFADTRQGSMQVVLDNLVADGKIEPVMAVFIDARDASDPSKNERNTQFLSRPEDFAKFIAEELVPTIDAAYRTDATAAGRTLVGVSFGGAFTTFAGLRYPDVFGNLTIFSPAYWVLSNAGAVGANAGTGAGRMNTLIQNRFSDAAFKTHQKIFISGGIPGWDVGDLKPWVTKFKSKDAAVQLFGSQEGHSWGAWTGLTDEMLEYFYAP